jgi:type IV pilus assembly protein PilB
MSLLDEFVKQNIVDRSEASIIEERLDEGKTLDEVLLSKKVDPVRIFNIKKAYYAGMPVREYNEELIPTDVLRYVPEKSAKHYNFVPIGKNAEGDLEIGVVDPDNLAAKSAIEFIANNNNIGYALVLIPQEYFEFVLKSYSGVKGEVKEALGILEDQDQVQSAQNIIQDTATSKFIEDAPITKIVSNILKYAAEKRASDIHVEVSAEDVSVRYRIDGQMTRDLVLPRNIHSAVVARIKILSKIKLDEKRVPQDGRFSANLLDRKIDFRVSTFPTYYGEKVVMRLLESDRGAMNINELGLTSDNFEKIKNAISKPYGIILVCGPTGSGKTNTLYSLLNELDKEGKNIISLENPIELNVPGVSQSQVHPEIGYTFATGLRAVLRQDPDIIMVGEIRDSETAQLAVQAALTGHMVFSTIHTNSASDVVQRLVNMGVEPYLIGPTLVATVGQRLAQTIAPDSGKEVPIPLTTKELIKDSVKDLPTKIQEPFLAQETIYDAVPSEEYPNGTKGRIGVFEVLEMNRELEEIILKDPSSLAIHDEARKNGFITLKEDAMLKAFSGTIPASEIMRL